MWDNPIFFIFLQNKKNHVTCFCTKSCKAQKKLAQKYPRQNFFRAFCICPPPPTTTPQRQADAKPQKKTSWIELVKGCLCLGTEPLNKKTMRKNNLSKHSFITTRYAVQTKNPQPATCKPRMRMPWRFTEVYWILHKTEIDCNSSRLDR
jgi:hypothetical protein